MARSDFQLNVRVPHKIIDEIKSDAAKERRTITAQINLIFEQYVQGKETNNANHA